MLSRHNPGLFYFLVRPRNARLENGLLARSRQTVSRPSRNDRFAQALCRISPHPIPYGQARLASLLSIIPEDSESMREKAY